MTWSWSNLFSIFSNDSKQPALLTKGGSRVGPRNDSGPATSYAAPEPSDITVKRSKSLFEKQAEQRATEPPGKLSKSFDWRARLRPKNGGSNLFYGNAQDSLQALIKESNGLIWQYTPTLTFTSSASYQEAQGQGMNYAINTYNQSKVSEITLNSDFTANDIYEAQYMLAAFNFLKIATKSYFGDSAVAQSRFGTPPPVMLFEYLGEQMFNKVPVVVSNYSITFSDSVDYVPVVWNGTTTYVPTQAQIMITMLPTYNPNKIRTRFDLDKIKNGQAYKDGFI